MDRSDEGASRRRFLKTAGLGALALTVSGALPGRGAAATAPPPPQNAISPQAALARLMEGNVRYAANQLDVKDFESGRAARAQAQHPIATVLSCADSRVAVELLFDQMPGDLFVLRIAGNYLNVGNLSSLEYGVAVLHTPLVMVLGHSQCGAIKAAIQDIQSPTPLPGHIRDITDAIRPGIASVVAAGGAKLLEHAVDANVTWNVARIAAAQPLIAEAVGSGRVRVVGAQYELATGRVRLL